ATAIEVPYPAALAVGLALAEVLWLEAHVLIEQLTVLIRVVVDLDDTAFRLFALDRLHGRRERGRDSGSAGAMTAAIAVAVRLEGGYGGLLANIVPTRDGVVVGE